MGNERGSWAGGGGGGWGDVDDEPYDSGGSGSDVSKLFFWLRPEETRRLLFLDGSPFCFHMHELYTLTRNAGDFCICLEKNRIAEECPICTGRKALRGDAGKRLFPTYVGVFTVIDMGKVVLNGKDVELEGFTTRDGNVIQFNRRLYVAKRGSQQKPGTLKQLQRLAQRRGGELTGTVWDVYRSGKKVARVGDDFQFVEAVHPDDWQKYLLDLGADEKYLKLDPFDYTEKFVPDSFEALSRVVGAGGRNADQGGLPGTGGGSGPRSEGAGYGEPPGSDGGDFDERNPPPHTGDESDVPF